MRRKVIRTKKTRRLTLEALELRLVPSFYYVSLTGSDSNPGTLAQPFGTINHGASVLTPGDTLYIRGGTYAEQLVDAIPGGTSWSAPVTISAYPGETVTLEPNYSTNAVLQFTAGSVAYIEIDNLILDARNLNAAVVWIDGLYVSNPSNHIRLKGCELRNSLNAATAEGYIITGKKVAGAAEANYNEVINCKIHDINPSGSSNQNHGMYIESSHNLIEGCQIWNVAGEGIQFWATNGVNGTNSSYNIFRDNIVHDTGLNDLVIGQANTAGVVVNIGDGNLVYNNIVYNSSVGFELNYGVTNTQLYNNTVYHTYTAQGQPGIFILNATNTDCENNIVANSAYSLDLYNLGTGSILKNNLVTQGIGYGSATNSGNITNANPLFVNAAAFDFHLQAGSPAIDAGVTLPQVPVDFDGLTRPQGPAYCIGAYEFPVNSTGTSHLKIAAGSSTTAGSSFSITVTALDANNNVSSGYTGTVSFTSSDAAAGLPGNYTFTAADAGVHTFTGVFLKTAGSQSITATDTVTNSITGSASVTVNPAAASTLVVSGYPSPTTAGTSQSFTVTADDAFGNTATSYRGTVAFSSSDSLAVFPANYMFTSTDAGVHSFSVTLKTAGSQSITVTDTASGSVTGSQTGITVTPAAAGKLIVNGYPSPTTAGVSHSFTVTAQDAFGNTASGYRGTVAFSSSDSQAVLPANYAFTSTDAGVHSFSVTLKTAGSQSITAKDTVTASITGTQSGITVNAAATSHFSISAPASATAGSSFSITVTALDANNNTFTNYLGTIQFSSSDAAASLPGNYTFTAADAGVHTFTGLVLKTAGSRSITATDTASSSVTGSASVTVNPAAASALVMSGYPSPTTAGTSHTFTVTVDDAYGNKATGYVGTVSFTSSDGQAVLPANYTFTSTDAGVHSFSATLKTAGSQSITVTDSASSSVTGSQTGITVNPAAASKLVVSGYPSPTTAGASHSFTVTADDAYGNKATGYRGTVAFFSSDSQAVLPANYTFTSTDAGVHSFSATLKTAGSQSITAKDTVTASITGTQSGITVSAAATSHFSISVPANATSGSSFSITVTALDASNNTLTSYLGTVQFTSSDVAASLPYNYTFTAADAGVHTFTGVVLTTAGSQSITATDTTSSSVTGSASVTVNPAAASTLVVSGYPSPTTAGTSHSFTVTADDAYGNTATGYVGTVSFTSSDGQAVLPGNYTFTGTDAGVHSFSATLKTAGSQSITITDTANSSINGSQSGITVNPAAASKLIVSGYPSPTAAGASHSFSVTAEDAFGNTASGYWGTVAFSSSDSQAVLPANYTFTSTDAGVHSFSATLKTVGSQSITAKDTVTTSVTGTESGITVNGAAVSGLHVTAPQNAKRGQAFTITVTAVDTLGNVVTSYLGTVHFASSDSQAVLPGNYTFSAADAGVHVFTSGVTLVTSGSQAVTATDTANASLTGQAVIKVNNGVIKPGLYGRVLSSGQWWAAVSNGSSAFTSASWGSWSPNATWVDVQTGDFNGDGQTDIIGRDLASGQWWVGLSNGSTFTTTLWGQWSPNVTWVDVKVGDFTGDGKDDIAGRVLENGQWWVGVSTGSSFATSLWTTWSPALSWGDVQVGDFNGDGKADLIGRVQPTNDPSLAGFSGQWWMAQSTGSSFVDSLWATWSPAVTWVDIQVGDFNGDGKDDIAGRVLQSGEWWVGLSTGSSFTTSLWATWSPAVTWVDVKVGDFNGDGKADIIGRCLQNGQWWVGLSAGSSFTTSLWATWSPAATWVDVQVGDFNGDGKADITGRVLQSGEWWTGLSSGSGFTTTLWDTWSPAVTWVDVRFAPNC